MPWLRRKSSTSTGNVTNDASATGASHTGTSPTFKRWSGTCQAAIADFEEDYGQMFGKQHLVDKARARRASIDTLRDKAGNPVRLAGPQASGYASNAPGVTAGTGAGAGAAGATAGAAAMSNHPQMTEHPDMMSATERDMAAGANASSMAGPDMNLHSTADTRATSNEDNLTPLKEESIDSIHQGRTSGTAEETYHTPPGSMKGTKLWGRRRNK
ncbi:hypothetical protein BDF22DRAFT_741409 [Syncephalis plumigaleata]|nr:hypothetical protein BDF22DRAFT_741409 [Syncephalis plumigaleata]